MLGGAIDYEGHKTNEVETYNGKQWKTVNNMNVARGSPGTWSMGLVTYVAGGMDDQEFLNSIEKYEGGTWTLLPIQLPFPNKAFGCVVLDNESVLLLGGMGGMAQETNKNGVFVMNCSTGEVAMKDSLDEGLAFPYNMWIVQENRLISYGVSDSHQAKLINYIMN